MARPKVLQRQRSLREIFDRHEGRLVHKCEHYFDIYERHFARFRGTSPRILEIGVSHGGSLDLWRQYFGRGTQLIGVDIDERCRSLEGPGVTIRIGDQGDDDFITSLQHDGPFDIVIDDGSHVPAHQILALERLWPSVSDGGVMLVEDLCTNYWSEYGGGYKLDSTFIEYVKPLVDDLNAYNSREDDLQPSIWTKTVGGMHVYDSVVVFEKAHTAPIVTLMAGRPSFDTLYGQPVWDALPPEHVARIESMNRPHRRALRALKQPRRSLHRAASVVRRAH